MLRHIYMNFFKKKYIWFEQDSSLFSSDNPPYPFPYRTRLELVIKIEKKGLQSNFLWKPLENMLKKKAINFRTHGNAFLMKQWTFCSVSSTVLVQMACRRKARSTSYNLFLALGLRHVNTRKCLPDLEMETTLMMVYSHYSSQIVLDSIKNSVIWQLSLIFETKNKL